MITLKDNHMNNFTISNELLMVGAKSEIGPITKKWIDEYIKISVDHPDPNDPLFKDLCAQYIKDVKRVTGINIALEIYDIPDLIMGVRSQITWFGHQGTRWYRAKERKIVSEDSVALKKLIQVDLKTGFVSGDIVKDLTYTFILSHQMLNGFGGFTSAENTASILHEFGHIINSFMYLGDYVWLNYYLTEGIEVMLGRKKAKVELELYNDRWMRENVPKEEYEAFTHNQTEEGAKRVILSVAKKLPRHHLTQNEITAKRREEQTADMYATRLGYGRDLASGLHKLSKYYEDPSLVGAFWFGEMAKLFATVLFLPFAIIGLMVYDPAGGDAHTMDGRYDEPMDRLVKIRRDLVAQLKKPGPLNKQALADDIDAIDEMIKEYSTNSSMFDSIINFFRPSVRKMRQNTKVEDDLESLMNNDLFLQAHKLSKM
jgi:hypothetical protein